MSNTEGKIKANLKPGKYKLKLSKKGYEQTNTEGGFGSIKITKSGHLHKDVAMKKK